MTKISKRKKHLISLFLVFALTIAGFNIYSNADADQYSANLIPTMTSNTAPSGIASASTESTYALASAYKAFDHIDPTVADSSTVTYAWATSSGTLTGWLAYDFGVPKTITKYTIAPENWLDTANNNDGRKRAPKNWTFEGWNGSTWVVLDTRSNITTWELGVRKEFILNNTSPYTKYRINISQNNGDTKFVAIGEMEMMETVQSSVTPPSAPLNLASTPDDAKADLTWSSVYDATGYNVKRSLTAGGPYTTIATNVYGTTFTDTPLTNGTTYYYIVTAANNGGESGASNEVAVTPQAQVVGGAKALLVITMVEGTEKEYDMTATEINAFINWYNGRAGGTGSSYYVINKNFNLGPFVARKDHLVFDKIVSFEVKEYN